MAAVWTTLGSYLYASAASKCAAASLCSLFIVLVWVHLLVAWLLYPALSHLFGMALDAVSCTVASDPGDIVFWDNTYDRNR